MPAWAVTGFQRTPRRRFDTSMPAHRSQRIDSRGQCILGQLATRNRPNPLRSSMKSASRRSEAALAFVGISGSAAKFEALQRLVANSRRVRMPFTEPSRDG